MNRGQMKHPITKLLSWRLAQGWTQDEVAALTGLSKAYISRLERGERCATPATKVEMARRLGASVSDLFEVEPVDEPKSLEGVPA
jgi:transcriptional regulator with XRE-family HTH domain